MDSFFRRRTDSVCSSDRPRRSPRPLLQQGWHALAVRRHVQKQSWINVKVSAPLGRAGIAPLYGPVQVRPAGAPCVAASAETVAHNDGNITALTMSNGEEEVVTMDINLEIGDLKALNNVMNDLRARPQVSQVKRSFS